MKKGPVFAVNLNQIAATLYFYAPKTYDYVRQKLNLALLHPQNTQKWYSNIFEGLRFTIPSFAA